MTSSLYHEQSSFGETSPSHKNATCSAATSQTRMPQQAVTTDLARPSKRPWRRSRSSRHHRRTVNNSNSKGRRLGGWFANRFYLLREFLHIAKLNGALRKDPSKEAAKDSSTMISAQQSQEEQLAALEEQFQTSTHEERLRFLRACKGNLTDTVKKLQGYIDWRELHGLDSAEYNEGMVELTSDEQHWDDACKRAMKYYESSESVSSTGKKKSSRQLMKFDVDTLPQIVFIHLDENGETRRTLDGTMILHVIPARIDKKLAAGEVYALAVCFYLDRKQRRDSMDLFCVTLDVRGGKGWANAAAYGMMPFIKAMAGLLHEIYPERLSKLVLYPLPRAAMWIWAMAKPFLDTSVVKRATLIGGDDARTSPPPNDALRLHFDEETVEALEKKRLSMFVEVSAAPEPTPKKKWSLFG